MFGIFKKKISDAISSISGKLGGKKETEEEKKKPAEEIGEAEEKIVEKKKVSQKAEKEKVKKQKPSKPQESANTEEPKEEIGKNTLAAGEAGEIRMPAGAEEPAAKEPGKEIAEKKEKKPGFFGKLKSAFTETKIADSALNDALWDLELVLLENNVAQEVAQKISADIKANLSGKAVRRGQIENIIKGSMRKTIEAELDYAQPDIEKTINSAKKDGRPAVIIFVGFNGSGKTTNIAKLGHYLKNKGYSCVFAAADSFRVAAIEQLEEHARRLEIPLIKHKYGADPAAVIFDAVAHAKSKGIDVVLADTAGRVHTDKNLVEELKKIVRVNKPDLKFLVVEAIAGNDVVEQARIFGEIGLDGVILSKWDIDEKGGAALSVAHTLKKPIVFLGTGQNYEDFEKFELKEVIESIF